LGQNHIVLEQKECTERLEGINHHTMKAIVNFIEPFKKASEILESTKKPSLYLCLPYYFDFLKRCEDQESDSEMTKEIKQKIKICLKTIWWPNLTIYHKTATFLYSPCREMSNFSQDEKIEMYKFIKGWLAELQPDVNDSEVNNDTASSADTETIRDSNFTIFSRSSYSIEDDISNVDSEINAYVKEKNSWTSTMCELEWWFENKNKYKNLYEVVQKLFCIPATSAASERSFSHAGNFLSDKRVRMNPEKLNKVLILNSEFAQTNLNDYFKKCD
jgi:hypothetical protein